MSIDVLRQFFMWSSIVSIAFMVATFPIVTFGGDFVHRLHSRWFSMTREQFGLIMYGFIGILKIIVLIVFVVPFLALTIISG